MKRAGELLEEPTGFDAFDAPDDNLEKLEADAADQGARADAVWRAAMRKRLDSFASRLQEHDQKLDAIEEGIRRLQRKRTRGES